ncbi:MAG: metal-dependent hydrolase [Nanoarchaeota archaeon]|nr:metal-dependent hydrolase [Nanoarchaeota archaeon]
MMFQTHLIFSILCSFTLLKFYEINHPIIFCLTFIFFGLIPDMDMPKSKLGKKHKIISNILHILFGHRGFIHTIFPAIFFFAIFYYYGFIEIAIASILGYLGHLLLDILTPYGLKVFYPFSKVNFRGFVKTGGFIEYIIQLLLVAVFIFQLKSFLGILF